ncbi:MAG: hypothetical protein OEV44_11785, partial [Spirochaetota bacterium]|nr:hypothetical protein [Spirochaetota bacterium]
YSEAIQLVNELLKENPRNPFALKSKGKIYFLILLNQDIELDDSELALHNSIDSLYKLLNTKSDEHIVSDVYFFLGVSYFIMGSDYYNKSLDNLENSAKLNSKDFKVNEFLKTHGYKSQLINMRLDNDFYSISLNGLIAYIAYEIGEYDKSINYFQIAAQEKQTSIIYHFYLSKAYRNQKLYDKAIEELKIVIHKAKRKDLIMQSYFQLSNIYTIKKDFAQAEIYIKKSQEINLSAESFYQFGLIYEAQGKITIAAEYWKKALKINSRHNKSRLKIIRYEKKINNNH